MLAAARTQHPSGPRRSRPGSDGIHSRASAWCTGRLKKPEGAASLPSQLLATRTQPPARWAAARPTETGETGRRTDGGEKCEREVAGKDKGRKRASDRTMDHASSSSCAGGGSAVRGKLVARFLVVKRATSPKGHWNAPRFSWYSRKRDRDGGHEGHEAPEQSLPRAPVVLSLLRYLPSIPRNDGHRATGRSVRGTAS